MSTTKKWPNQIHYSQEQKCNLLIVWKKLHSLKHFFFLGACQQSHSMRREKERENKNIKSHWLLKISVQTYSLTFKIKRQKQPSISIHTHPRNTLGRAHTHTHRRRTQTTLKVMGFKKNPTVLQNETFIGLGIHSMAMYCM